LEGGKLKLSRKKCRTCKKNIRESYWLPITIFVYGKETKHWYFCCWKCVIRKIKKFKGAAECPTIHLPAVDFDCKRAGCGAKDFFDLFKKKGK